MSRYRLSWLVVILAALAGPSFSQQPFFTDDPGVTESGKLHFEFFNELDALQRPQFPNLRQNTANYKLNFGLPHNLEVDLDSPYLAIFRSLTVAPNSSGLGDTNLGMKWNFRQESDKSKAPGMAVTFYVEFPTGDESRELGSGLHDYWLNFIAQKHLSAKNRVTLNTGLLFAGNTSTGVIGIQTTRGRVYTGGVSLLHELNSRWTIGTELYVGFTNNLDLGRGQFQILTGGKYTLRQGLTLDFGVLGGKYVASPRIGGQLGFSIDFPQVFSNGRSSAK